MARPRAAFGYYRRSVRVREGRELPGDEGDRRGRVLMDTRPPSVGRVGVDEEVGKLLEGPRGVAALVWVRSRHSSAICGVGSDDVGARGV